MLSPGTKSLSPFPEFPTQPCAGSRELPGLFNQRLHPGKKYPGITVGETVLEQQVLVYTRYRQQFSWRLIPEIEKPPFPQLLFWYQESQPWEKLKLNLGKNLNRQPNPREYNRAIGRLTQQSFQGSSEEPWTAVLIFLQRKSGWQRRYSKLPDNMDENKVLHRLKHIYTSNKQQFKKISQNQNPEHPWKWAHCPGNESTLPALGDQRLPWLPAWGNSARLSCRFVISSHKISIREQITPAVWHFLLSSLISSVTFQPFLFI